MSSTSSHCVENDRISVPFELGQMHLTQPSRNLYKAKTCNGRNIDETSLCQPFKTMTSPQALPPRNHSLLTHFNDITDQFKDTSPPDIIPYKGNKYGQNASTLPGKLMTCPQNNIENGIKKDSPQDNTLDYLKSPQKYQVENRKGDGSNCSYVSRFINSQRSGYMDQKFNIANMNGENQAHLSCPSHPDPQFMKMLKNKPTMTGPN